MALPDGDLSPARTGTLVNYYESLFDAFGPQGWWPGRTRLEVILGAILTQNAAWRNASLAIGKLRKNTLLRIQNLRQARPQELEIHIRQAGFYRQKARTIARFIERLDRDFGGSLSRLFAQPHVALRQYLLDIKGLGPETVDAILLYAGRKPYFVADGYTRRILARHGWLPANAKYEAAQKLLHRELPRDWRLFNEFHALIVEAGKRYCKRGYAACEECPLREYLPGAIASGAPKIGSPPLTRPAPLATLAPLAGRGETSLLSSRRVRGKCSRPAHLKLCPDTPQIRMRNYLYRSA